MFRWTHLKWSTRPSLRMNFLPQRWHRNGALWCDSTICTINCTPFECCLKQSGHVVFTDSSLLAIECFSYRWLLNGIRLSNSSPQKRQLKRASKLGTIFCAGESLKLPWTFRRCFLCNQLCSTFYICYLRGHSNDTWHLREGGGVDEMSHIQFLYFKTLFSRLLAFSFLFI